MVQAKDISFVERKSLPTVCLLNTTFGIKYNSNSQQFDTQNYEIELNGFTQILAGGIESEVLPCNDGGMGSRTR